MRNLLPSLICGLSLALVAAPAPSFAQATGTPKAGAKSLSSTDKKFAKDAAESIVGILHLTEMVIREGTPGSEAVKALAKPMGVDLNTAYGELGTASKEMPSTDKSSGEKRTIDALKKAKPTEFDKLYLKTIEKESKKLSSLAEGGGKSLQDAELKAWAEKWAPKLKEQHDSLDKAEKEESKKK